MANAPDLLNDDGSASMATALLMSHHGFRRDIARFAEALRRVGGGDHAFVAALGEEWQIYRGHLHEHHQAEDTGLFPHIRSAHPDLGPVIEQLIADHRRIDPLLEEGDRAFGALPAATDSASSIVSQLSALLDAHLALEEAQIVFALRDAKVFPPPATEKEATLYAEGFAWACHGVADDVLERVYAMLPGALTARLPAARAVFEKRSERVWGPTKPGASRKAIPDWLANSER
jgi:hypothetical protein